MEYFFSDVLEIKNGKNQKGVENPEGRYPIYGSGGVMGYAGGLFCFCLLFNSTRGEMSKERTIRIIKFGFVGMIDGIFF